MARGKKPGKWLALLEAVLVILVAAFAYIKMNSKPPAVDSANLVKAEIGDIARSVVATGVIEPISNRIEIRSKASGIVKQVNLDVGDRVKPDQVLVELDRDQLLAQLREAEANLQAAGDDVIAGLWRSAGRLVPGRVRKNSFPYLGLCRHDFRRHPFCGGFDCRDHFRAAGRSDGSGQGTAL
jgi:hypothetical protein